MNQYQRLEGLRECIPLLLLHNFSGLRFVPDVDRISSFFITKKAYSTTTTSQTLEKLKKLLQLFRLLKTLQTPISLLSECKSVVLAKIREVQSQM